MQNSFKSRHAIFNLAIISYFLPLFILTLLHLRRLSLSQSWEFLSWGLFLSLIGSLLLYFVLKGWEEALRQQLKNGLEQTQSLPLSQSFSDVFQEDQIFAKLKPHSQLLECELEQKSEELARYNQREEEIKKLSYISEEFAGYRLEMEQQIEEREQLIHALRQEIEEQKTALQNKNTLIEDLEKQVQDRKYEMQTLLKISENPQLKSEVFKLSELPENRFLPSCPASQENKAFTFQSHKKMYVAEGASTHLKQCIEIAQNITGVNHLSSHPSVFRDLPVNSTALDLRRLGDSLGSQHMAAVAVYSKKENKLLYANHQIRHLLGWSLEKFLQDFPEIVQDGLVEWRKQIQSLSTSHEAKIRLIMKTKFGENLLLNCHLGLIPRGIFYNHVIAVFYP